MARELDKVGLIAEVDRGFLYIMSSNLDTYENYRSACSVFEAYIAFKLIEPGFDPLDRD